MEFYVYLECENNRRIPLEIHPPPPIPETSYIVQQLVYLCTGLVLDKPKPHLKLYWLNNPLRIGNLEGPSSLKSG